MSRRVTAPPAPTPVDRSARFRHTWVRPTPFGPRPRLLKKRHRFGTPGVRPRLLRARPDATGAADYTGSDGAHDESRPRVDVLRGRCVCGNHRSEVDGPARPRPLRGPPPLLRARALMCRDQPAHPVGAAPSAG